MTHASVDIVVPTVARASLDVLVGALLARPLPGRLLLVDDRPSPDPPLEVADGRVEVVAGVGGGPASARNLGWRASSADWVAFLDDDVVPSPTWAADLLADLAGAGDDVAAIQGRVHVPLPVDRRPNDWERNVAGLETGVWITADMAVRRAALAEAGGFDERFPRAYREDADLAVRLEERGHRLVRGSRSVDHPVPPAPWHVSVAKQRGNVDDALMRRIHGRRWRARAGAPAGAFRRHLVTTAAALVAFVCLLRGQRRLSRATAAAWVTATADFARRRLAPGPRDRREVAAMALTSAAVPPAAVWWRAVGELRARRVARLAGIRPAAVLFDRDGTLVVDVPYNGDPARVLPVPGAAGAVARLRAAGLRTAIVSNQSGVARGLLTRADVDAVNARVASLLGGFDAVAVCPHGADDGCECRKPRPGLVDKAAAELGVRPRDCVVVGDIGSDVDAALAAGARAVLVPTPQTRRREVWRARAARRRGVAVARDLVTAADVILGVPR